MPRPRTKIGQFGEIRVETLIPQKKYQAHARYRDESGDLRKIKATSTSKTAAIQLVKDRIEEMRKGVLEVNSRTKISVLAEIWYKEKLNQGLKYRTIERARSMLDVHILPKFGKLLIQECSTALLHGKLNALAVQNGVATAIIARTTLSGMMSTAIRFGALSVNPVSETVLPKTKRDPIRVLTYDQYMRMREVAAERLRPLTYDERLAKAGGDTRRMGGDNREPTVQDVIEMLMGTAARASEVIAVTLPDLHLDGDVPYVRINKQIIRHRRTPDGGGGLKLDPTKEEDTRLVALPNFTVEMLKRRLDSMTPNKWDAVFLSERGTLLDPSGMRKQWRKTFLGTEFEWVTQKTIRKTVATIIAAENGSQAASEMLGHTHDAVTKRHYIAQSLVPVDERTVIELFGT